MIIKSRFVNLREGYSNICSIVILFLFLVKYVHLLHVALKQVTDL